MMVPPNTNTTDPQFGQSIVTYGVEGLTGLDAPRQSQGEGRDSPNMDLSRKLSSGLTASAIGHQSELGADHSIFKFIYKSNPTGEFCEPNFEGDMSCIDNNPEDSSNILEKGEIDNFMCNMNDHNLRSELKSMPPNGSMPNNVFFLLTNWHRGRMQISTRIISRPINSYRRSKAWSATGQTCMRT
jgi:hypothetical protein